LLVVKRLTLHTEWKATTKMPLSSSQFSGDDTPTPMSLGSSTTGSFAQQTAWRTPRKGSTPLAYSKKTAGTTFKWDDDSQGSQLPKSDKGAGRNAE
jgi:hypothetical protein